MEPTAALILPVIMCGGSGTRLWPASRGTMPKQFIDLVGARSTFQSTAERVSASDLFFRFDQILDERRHDL